MLKKEKIDDLFGHLLDNAIEGFRETEEYYLLEEKLAQMNRDCETMFKEDEQQFAEECFELMSDISDRKETHLYRQGLLDGVIILKELGVLA